MTDSRLDETRGHVKELKRSLASGVVDQSTYRWLMGELLSDLTPWERQVLGTDPDGDMGKLIAPYGPSLAEFDLAPGTVLFEQWRIIRELGRGGFGVVFEAEELRLGETHAVKVLDPAMMSRPELLARFRREVSVMRRLDPRHIVRVYDYREDPEQHLALISMEYVLGGTVRGLRDLAREKEQAVPVAAVVAILTQTLAALTEAHDQGVIHRDVTPGNILLAGAAPEEMLAEPARDFGVKLVDFGIAGLVEHAALSQMTPVLGTVLYMAPEALEPGDELTPAADLYGVGVVAYELLTAKLPLGRFPKPSETRTDVPPELDQLVLEMIDVDPARRPSARLAQEAVSRITVAPETTQSTTPPLRAVPLIAWFRSRWTWIAVATLVVAVFLMVFSYHSTLRSRAQGSPPATRDHEGPEIPAGEVLIEMAIADGMRFRYIPSGSFTMGSPEDELWRIDNEIQNEVTLTRAFLMGETEVTQAQWRAVMGNAPSFFQSCGDDCPVEQVSWYDAVTFANRLSDLSGFARCYELAGNKETPGGGCPEGRFSCQGTYLFTSVDFSGLGCNGYRLPTEAEWEYAARAGTETALYTGPLTIRDGKTPELDKIAWYWSNSRVSYAGGYDCGRWPCGTHQVGQKVVNGWGLSDMLGNVSEWTWDWYAEYEGGPTTDPMVSSRAWFQVISDRVVLPWRGSKRVTRGGSWHDSYYCRPAFRGRRPPGNQAADTGFRLVRTWEVSPARNGGSRVDPGG